MFVFFNNNPQGMKIGDCVIRAISTALDQTWERTYVDLCIEGFMFSDLPNSNVVWDSFLRSKGYKKRIIPDSCPDCYTFERFAEEKPQGTYLVCTGEHTACIKDGKILDNWDSSSEIVSYYYAKE
jgi:hypothetical protein